MDTSNSILEMDAKVSTIMKDLRKRVQFVYDKYTDKDKKIPVLPPYDVIVNSSQERYNLARRLTMLIDELSELKLRVGVVYRSVVGMRNVQVTAKSDYTLISNFKNNLKKYEEELSEYKFEIQDLIKNANNKIRILESAAFYND